MKKSRVAFELPSNLHKKLQELCEQNSLSVSEYLRGLIAREYNNSAVSPTMTDTTVLGVLKRIEKNTRPNNLN